MQYLMEIADAAWLPSLTQLFGIQLLYMLGSQLLELDMAYRGQDVLGKERFLFQVGRRANRLLLNVLKPLLEIFPDGLARPCNQSSLSNLTLHLLQQFISLFLRFRVALQSLPRFRVLHRRNPALLALTAALVDRTSPVNTALSFFAPLPTLTLFCRLRLLFFMGIIFIG